ncbi:PREDICTED: KAT8 regulatory NSL complex subunit 2-like [Priapulus caudatus]|uniref:KAT8 regulatory NSL complex subunit 2 n=1 Tax=Priapulus caudatus TaxID=37621 RepID=A0ABM1EY79_PRICU|nr:PREDICTED: KAT8 regulatory NSL complex subunit 2-like [Priapulus caudatus]XP_014677150.1 PREDICTED: KAT8 regulatory NSL complex subunit 2-like [Priapulus caudatus]
MFKQKIAISLQRPKPKGPIEGLFCNYSHRICMQTRIEGSEYCIRHILEDKNAPYKQCSYVSSKHGRRCHGATPKSDKRDGYCAEHAKKTTVMRQRALRKKRPAETPDSLMAELVRYDATRGLEEPGTSAGELSGKKHESAQSAASRILDYASESESEQETVLVDQTWRGDGDSDAESIDSEQEDPLKHAGVYTAEEVALMTRDKLIRLQSLYIDQFKRLQHMLREKRRKYLLDKKNQDDLIGGDHMVIPSSLQAKRQYDKLHALKRYHRRHGKEALLHQQSKQRRIVHSEGDSYQKPAVIRCSYVVDGATCNAQVLPLTSFCQRHICHDVNQLLYVPCNHGDPECDKPIVMAMEDAACPVHTVLPLFKDRLLPEEASDAEATHSDTLINVDKSDSEEKTKRERTETGSSEDLPLVSLASQQYLEHNEEQRRLLNGSAFKQENMPLTILASAGPSTAIDTDLIQAVTAPSDRPGSPLLETDSKDDPTDVNIMSPETDVEK